MKTVIFIPARYASTRFPAKPLAKLQQGDGSSKTLIQMSWEAAQNVKNVDDVYVATDNEEIRDHAESFGAKVVMTSEACENGTARCSDALAQSGVDADLIVNFQGDAPLTPPWFVEALIDTMKQYPDADVATPVLQCDPLTYGHFVEDRKAGRVGGTTAVFDAKSNALFFSKEVLPYIDPDKVPADNIPVYHHVGVYAYRTDAIRKYTSWPVSQLETLEGLEQLRFLVNDTKVKCVEVEAKGRVFWELNNPEDVSRIESVLKDLS